MPCLLRAHLAPLYDVLLQLGKNIPEGNIDITKPHSFFHEFFT